MKKYSKSDFEILKKCPWCGSDRRGVWGRELRGFKSARCGRCGLVYVENRFNEKGLQKFYKNYFSEIHQFNKKLNEQRDKMYLLEFDLINLYCKKGSVLDIGCSGGYFLDFFKEAGWECFGVEYGEEAVGAAQKKHSIFFGDFANLKINKKFDLIILRGTIEHIPYPKTYLAKAVKLLKKGGCIYITSTPNADSFCCRLFREMWNQHVPEEHLMHFSPKHFDNFFYSNFIKIREHFFYEETPYAEIEKDILSVARAINLKKKTRRINFRSPAFYHNMMSLIYKKK